MATFRITRTNSVLIDDGNGAFISDTAGPDTLIIEQNAFLKNTDGLGAYLLGTGAWSATINGSVFSQNSYALILESDTQGVSTITVGARGKIEGIDGVSLPSETVDGIGIPTSSTIKNSGTIIGHGGGVGYTGNGISMYGPGTRTVTNTGVISGTDCSIFDVTGETADKITNSGTLNGMVELNSGNGTLTNSGKINGDASFGTGINKLTNSGTITGLAAGWGDSDNTFVNSGTIGGVIFYENGTNKLTNSGLIGDVTGGFANDTITNSKTFGGDVDLREGVNYLTNTGVIKGSVFGGAGRDTVTNTGTVFQSIDLGGGSDTFIGGKNIDVVIGGGGADSVMLGAGNDVYVATGNDGAEGNDTIDGGTGIDTYDASASTTALLVNLDHVSHDRSPYAAIGTDEVAANTATGGDVAGAGRDSVLNFENLEGGAGADIIYGSSLANDIAGNDGADYLFGFGGKDALDGGAGADSIDGGAGKDTLTGGTDADVFLYAVKTDSGPTKATRDVITDFEVGFDQIDLSAIDAKSTTAGDDAFTFIGSDVAFGRNAGELRARWVNGSQIVEGDINGDAKADFSIEIIDAGHSMTITDADFIL